MGEKLLKGNNMEETPSWNRISFLFPCVYARTFQYEIIQFLQFISYSRFFNFQWHNIYDSIFNPYTILALQNEKNSNGSSNSLSHA